MRIFLPQIEIGDEEGFSKKDIFDYSKSGESLTNLIQKVEDPMVIALDGPWGSGKTTFAKMWLGELRKKRFPVIYFDAFANDYMDDAFMAIAGEVISLAGEKTDKKSDKYNVKYDDLVAKLVGVLKILGISGLKAGAKFLTLNVLNDESLKDLVSMIANEASECDDVYLKSLLEKNKEKHSAIQEFKTALEEMVREFPSSDPDGKGDEENKTDARRPLVFILDELDRCKPVFALELLEKIKHFFLVKGVVFVLVVNLEQLESSVKHSYGDGIEARTYLEKFYHVIFHLPEETGYPLRHKTSTFLRYIFKQLSNDGSSGELEGYIEDYLEAVSIEKSFSLRTVEKIVTHIRLVLAAANDNESMNDNKSIRGILITGLCVLKIVEPELYIKARNNTLTLKEIKDFFRFDKWDRENGTFSRRIWTRCLADELPENELPENRFPEDDDLDWHRFGSDFDGRYITNRDRETIIPQFCRWVDSFDLT